MEETEELSLQREQKAVSYKLTFILDVHVPSLPRFFLLSHLYLLGIQSNMSDVAEYLLFPMLYLYRLFITHVIII